MMRARDSPSQGTRSESESPGEPAIGLELGRFSEVQRSTLLAQYRAFLLPQAARLLDGLRAAGGRLSSPVIVRFDPCESGTARPGERSWAHTVVPLADGGLDLLERMLVQIGESAIVPAPSLADLHELATTLICSAVDPTYVSALELSRAEPSSAPVPTRPRSRRTELLVCSLSANAHDSSVAVGNEDEVLIVLEAERVHRRKRKWCNGPELENLAGLALAAIGREPGDVTHWTGTAMLNGLLPREHRTCAWTAEVPTRIFAERTDFKAVNHHLAHAALAFAEAPGKMVVEACDGGGDGRRYATFAVDGSSIEPFESTGTGLVSGSFYDICAYYLYKEYAQQGKLMGLAAHGSRDRELEGFLRDNAAPLSFGSHEDAYALLDARIAIERHDPDDRRVRDAAHTVQRAFADLRVKQATALAAGSRRLVLTGGAALNIHANSAIADALPGCEVVVPPCCDDTGEALGALLFTTVCELGARPKVPLPFLGAGTKEPPEIDAATADRVADDLLAGNVVAWHYGRAEIGPRALGHRSLLCVAHSVENRVMISERVKGRESYRPVAPVVLVDRLGEWFEPARPSPFMLFAAMATELCRDRAPAVVHVDGSARVQTVARDEQPLGPILTAVEQRTGVPLLVNTSLNGPGEPISDRPQDTLAFARRHPEIVAWVDGTRVG